MKIQLIILNLLLACFAYAQEQNSNDIALSKKNEFAIGNGAMFLGNNGNNYALSAPALIYKRKINAKNHFLRAALFVKDYSKKEEVPFRIQSSSTNMKMDYKVNETLSANFSIAYEWEKYARDNKRLRYTYGLGLMVNMHEDDYHIESYEYELNNGIYNLKDPSTSSYDFPTNTAKTSVSVGGIGYVSLDYLIGKRLFLGVQANYMIGISNGENKAFANAIFLPMLSYKF